MTGSHSSSYPHLFFSRSIHLISLMLSLASPVQATYSSLSPWSWNPDYIIHKQCDQGQVTICKGSSYSFSCPKTKFRHRKDLAQQLVHRMLSGGSRRCTHRLLLKAQSLPQRLTDWWRLELWSERVLYTQANLLTQGRQCCLLCVMLTTYTTARTVCFAVWRLFCSLCSSILNKERANFEQSHVIRMLPADSHTQCRSISFINGNSSIAKCWNVPWSNNKSPNYWY